MITLQELKEEVKLELDYIIANTTSKQIALLDYPRFSPESSRECIYAQLNKEGGYYSNACDDLRVPSAKYDILFTDKSFEYVLDNGGFNLDDSHLAYTPLEMYIGLTNTNVEDIFKYLRGEITKIEL